jgi:DNA helicase-2/ATP-dependent DNA helicase PcrA
VVSRIRSELAEGGLGDARRLPFSTAPTPSRGCWKRALLRMAIPYRIYGGLRFYDRLEIKHALAYLCGWWLTGMTMRRSSGYSTCRCGASGPKVSIPCALLRSDQGCSLWDAIHMAAQPSTSRFAELVDTMAAEFYRYEGQGEMGQGGWSGVIHLSGLIPHFEKEKGEKGQTRIENLEELVNAAAEFSGGGAPDGEDERQLSPLQQFLDSAAPRQREEGQAEEWEESIQLMTLHSSKGLVSFRWSSWWGWKRGSSRTA